MKRPDLSPATVAPAVAAALACALAGAWGLSALARPAGFPGRMAAVERDLAETQKLSAAPGEAGAYPVRAICAQPPEQAAQLLRQRVAAAAAASGVAAPGIEVAPRRLDFEHGLPSVDVRVEASGRYDALAAMLARLASDQPAIFVDTLDLQPRVSVVNLKLNGHLFCRTSAASRS